MSTATNGHCEWSDNVHLLAVQALPASEVAETEQHIAHCDECARELAAVRPAVDALTAWPTNILRPTTASLWERLATRIAADTGRAPLARPGRERTEWTEVATGIEVCILANEANDDRVSMLVRLQPNTDYPPHSHAGVEELYLLDGILLVDDKIMYPGDFLYSRPGTADARVYSETGCTCVLITSTRDELR